MSEQTGSWQPDPFGRHQYRYWDGAAWSDQVADDGVASTDPPVAQPAPTEPEPTSTESSAPGTESPPPDATMVGVPAATTGQPTAAVSPPPTEPTAPASEDRNPLPLLIGGLVVALLLAGVAVYLFVLADDDDDDDLRARVASSFQSDFGLSSGEADCVTNEIDDSIGLDRIADSIQDGREPTALQRAAIADAFDQCGVAASALPSPPTTGDPTDDTTPDDASPTTTTPDDDGNGLDLGGVELSPAMVAMMAQQIATQLGMTQQQAECYLTEILEEFTLEEMMALGQNPEALADGDMGNVVLDIFDRCDIDPETLG